MKEKLYITGHKNPDTDSICAAIAYAELKNRRGENAEAIRLGDLNQETQFVLEYFGVQPPRFKDTMKPQVRDLDMDDANAITPDISLNKALSIIEANHNNDLPTVDYDENLLGIVSLTDINSCYMEVWDDRVLGRSGTPIENILEVISGKVLFRPETIRKPDGRMTVFAMRPDTLGDGIGAGDIVIVGDREDAQLDAIERDVSILILCGGSDMNEEILARAKQKNVTILTTEFSSFMCARLLPQAVPVSYVMSTEGIVSFSLDDYIDEVRMTMANTRFRSYPVLNHQNRVIGNVSRYHLISGKRKKLILVDHNERNQSVDDIDTADIVEIIDHHRVANISTDGPVYFRNEAVGSTSTIISKMYFESGVRPPREIAGILAAAIISDTLYFRSPTSTNEDRLMLDRLTKIAGIQPEQFAEEMFKAGTSLENRKIADLLNGDVKQFMIEGEPIRVAQVFTTNLDHMESIHDELLEEMEELRIEKGERTFVVILTDIFQELSEVMVTGDYAKEIAEAFDTQIVNHTFIAKGLLSRKKQLVPKLHQAINAARGLV